jgi:flagellar hook-associated protein 3 FlgL
MMDRSMLEDVNRSLSRLAESQQSMASQKKITKPSDSPGDLQALLAVKDQLSVSDQYKSNIAAAQLRLQKADSGVNNISDQLMAAKQAAMSSTGAMSAGARAALGEQVEGIIKSVMDEANAKDGAEYVFAGTASSAIPFTAVNGADADGTDRIQSVAYAGNGADRAVSVSSSQTSGTGLSGSELAPSGPGGIFETLIALRKALESGADTAQIQADLDANMDRLDQAQVKLGSQLQSLTGLSERIGAASLDMEAKRSSIEDTDFTAEVLKQGQRQAEYQAVLAATAKRSQLSLINYL